MYATVYNGRMLSISAKQGRSSLSNGFFFSTPCVACKNVHCFRVIPQCYLRGKTLALTDFKFNTCWGGTRGLKMRTSFTGWKMTIGYWTHNLGFHSFPTFFHVFPPSHWWHCLWHLTIFFLEPGQRGLQRPCRKARKLAALLAVTFLGRLQTFMIKNHH